MASASIAPVSADSWQRRYSKAMGPVFSILNQYGGKTFAVYDAGSLAQFRQVKALSEQDRVQSYGPADYSEGTHTHMWLTSAVEDIALEIVQRREEALGDRVGRPPRHILEASRPQRPRHRRAQPRRRPTPRLSRRRPRRPKRIRPTRRP